jgi:pyruvate oxidase/acetolactate synthase-1/2/3 large subunit
MRAKTVSEVIVEQLAAWSVEYIFGLPGTTCLGLVDAIRKHDGIRFIKVRHEEAAALMASAYAKLTGKVGVCLTIAGPGATNLITGLYDAKMDRAPVLAITGQVKLQYIGPGSFQEIDQEALFNSFCIFNKSSAFNRRSRATGDNRRLGC